MHEQSIVEALLGLLVKHAERVGAKRILKIYLVVGELSGIVEEAMELYFAFASRNTIAEGAALFFTRVPAQLRCRSCGKVFQSERHNYLCPDCKEAGVDILSGRELYVERMEVE